MKRHFYFQVSMHQLSCSEGKFETLKFSQGIVTVPKDYLLLQVSSPLYNGDGWSVEHWAHQHIFPNRCVVLLQRRIVFEQGKKENKWKLFVVCQSYLCNVETFIKMLGAISVSSINLTVEKLIRCLGDHSCIYLVCCNIVITQ